MSDPYIDKYRRADAIRDGALVDVTPHAAQLGIRYPVAITCALWSECVAVPHGVAGQDEAGRLHDLLFMYRAAVLKQIPSRHLDDLSLAYELLVRNDNRPGPPPLRTVKAVCGPGDDLEPVITLLLPEED